MQVVPNDSGGVKTRPVNSSKDIEQLKMAAVKMQNRQSKKPDVNSAINGLRLSSTNGELTQRYDTDRKRVQATRLKENLLTVKKN